MNHDVTRGPCGCPGIEGPTKEKIDLKVIPFFIIVAITRILFRYN